MMKKRCMAVWIILGLLLSMLPVSANTQQNAKSLSVNGTVSGSITEAEEVNWYQVNIPSAGRLRFQITSTMNLLGIAFFDSNQKMICTDEVEDIQGKSKTLDFYLEKGSYYVRVVGYYGEYDHSYYYGNYSFQTKFTASGTNRSRNNNSFKTAVKIPTKAKVVGQISANHPFEYFKISLPSSGRLEVKGTSYLEYFGIRIYDSKYNKLDGETIEKDAASKKGTFTKQYDLQKGTYYIWTIGNYEGGTEARYYGKYKFNTKFVSAKVNHKEPNNTIKKAVKIKANQTIRGQIALNNDVDYYKITLSRGGKINIKITGNMTSVGYQILNKSNESVTYGGVSFSAENNKETKVCSEELAKGTYYIRFIGAYGSSAESYCYGNYSFRITR